MNKKIFTLLAGALLLLLTANEANAKLGFGSTLSGDVVKTLPDGTGQGLYHIRIDSILDTVGYDLSTGEITLGWKAVSANPGTWSITNINISEFFGITPIVGVQNDTIVLAVNQYGKLIPISMRDFRRPLSNNGLTYKDLQATMWCINVDAPPYSGQWPIFDFRNKAFGGYLNFSGTSQFLGSKEHGSMFSPSYNNEQLMEKQPLYRTKKDEGTTNIVLVYRAPEGIQTVKMDAYNFTNNTYDDQKVSRAIAQDVVGLLKVSIVEVGPVVLDADAFNTQLGEKTDNSLTQLKFDPEANIKEAPNYFSKKLWADNVSSSVISNSDGRQNYLHLYVDNDRTKRIMHNFKTGADDDRYFNKNNRKYLEIGTGTVTTANAKYSAYRFVYFPSLDSLVINAYEVQHYNNPGITLTNDSMTFNAADAASATTYPNSVSAPFKDGTRYHGLYNDVIFNRLIVRMQDLDNTNNRLTTIDSYPANTHISFEGVFQCKTGEDNLFDLDEGLYTVWDNRGRVLGVRIYQGALVPQWLELEEGECPDRIPSYQWYIDKHDDKYYRFYNREFADMINRVGNNGGGAMNHVHITVGAPTPIFGAGANLNFNYGSLVDYAPTTYEPIANGYVAGAYIDTAAYLGCGLNLAKESGFRPVNPKNASDPYLGYKHFVVNNDDDSSPKYGKSEEVGFEKGMDYNAYSFNYYSAFGDDAYIGLNDFAGETILRVSPKQDAFQFQLGTQLRRTGPDAYQEEPYGYPKEDLRKEIKGKGGSTIIQDISYLKRYYYELKIADFYSYRDGLHEQFAVLKGAGTNVGDARNALRYGVANALATNDPFQYANVYLRESYFIAGRDINDEGSKYPGFKTYYAILDRIQSAQFEKLADMGAEITRIPREITPADTASYYGIVTWGVEDAVGYVKAQGRTLSSTRVSTFALENAYYPLYRRLNSAKTDGANGEGLDMGVTPDPRPYDAPKILRINAHFNDQYYLYEDALSGESFNKNGINFLGYANSQQYPEDEPAPDGTYKYNYNLFVDTAFINRGTGPIKPQYLIAVAPQIVKGQTIISIDPTCNDTTSRIIQPYIRARYLINATDSARMPGSPGIDKYAERDKNYITNLGKDRLAFVDAIHIDDRLYIVGRLREVGITEDLYTDYDEDNTPYISAEMLRMRTAGLERRPNSVQLGVYYDFGNWNDYHNDVSFSLRFVDKTAKNASVSDKGLYEEGSNNDASDNYSKRFLIESETTHRTIFGNRKIAPVQGGWLQINNGAVILSRGAYHDAIEQSEKFNIEIPASGAEATDNGSVAAESLQVIAGTGEVSILNVSGKKVSIANVLGQTIANFVAGSDNATVKAPKGIVVVTVEGEKTVKAIVK